MNSSIDPNFDWENARKNYLGAYYQLSFSNLFNLSKIKFRSHCSNEYPHFIYWMDGLNKCIRFTLKGGNKKKKVKQKHISKSIYVPIQCIKIML